MKIGIIGSGNMGSGLGILWAKKGHELMFSFSRDPKALDKVAAASGENAAQALRLMRLVLVKSSCLPCLGEP
jgi:predicted dinucleotide-binding enzyme